MRQKNNGIRLPRRHQCSSHSRQLNILGWPTVVAVLNRHNSWLRRPWGPHTWPRRKTFAAIDPQSGLQTRETSYILGRLSSSNSTDEGLSCYDLVPEDSKPLEHCLQTRRHTPPCISFCGKFQTKSLGSPTPGPSPDLDSFVVPIALTEPMTPGPFPLTRVLPVYRARNKDIPSPGGSLRDQTETQRIGFRRFRRPRR